jgi:Ca2+-transporting ATPase
LPRAKSAWRYHHVPGRLRLFIPELCRNPAAAQDIQNQLSAIAGVQMAAVNISTGRALVIYNASNTSLDTLLLALSKLRRKLRTGRHPGRRPKQNILEPEDDDLQRQTWRLAGTGGALGFLALQRALLGPSRFAASRLLFYLSAATTIVSTYPMLRSGFGYALHKFNLNHDMLLGLAGFGLLVSRGNLLGLTVIWLSNLSAYIQSRAVKSSKDTVKRIIASKQRKAAKRVAGPDTEVEYYLVASGQRIPADGEVDSGVAVVDESTVTGSTLTLIKTKGSEVMSGSWVKLGEIIVASRTGPGLSLEKQLDRIVNRSNLITKNRRAINLYAERISWAALLISLGTYLLWRDLNRSLAVLIAASPSAASLSVVTAYRAGLANAARKGILVKDLQSLELLTETDAVLLDKTGTVTFGQPKVESVISLDERYPSEEIISLAAASEQHLSHPVARSLVGHASQMGLKIQTKTKRKVMMGQGVRCVVNGKTVLIGNRQLMVEEKINLRQSAFRAKQLLLAGLTVTYVAVDSKIVGLIGLRDNVRPGSLNAIEGLRAQGVERIGLLTGDSQEFADILGRNLGISEIWGDAMPHKKVEIVKRLQEEGKVVTVVGDGINDIPAFRTADISVALSIWREALTLEAASIVIVGSNLAKLNDAIHISKISSEVARQNMILSVGSNLAGIALTIGVYSNPLAVTALNYLGSLAVIFNSTRLFNSEGSRKGLSRKHRPRIVAAPKARAAHPASRRKEAAPALPGTSGIRPIQIARKFISRVWFEMAADEVITALQSHPETGLSYPESKKRLEVCGFNLFHEQGKTSALVLFFGQFQNLVTKLLLTAGVVSLILGEFTDGISILLILVMGALVGAIQQYRAEKSLAALKKLAVPEALVIRDGREQRIPAKELVPGDVVMLEAGCLVPADCRLLDVSCLEVLESSLTGESMPVAKQCEVCPDGHMGVAEQNNMVFMGSLVTKGRAKAVVVNTGIFTEMGKIAAMLKEVEAETTPLQKQLNKLGQDLSLLCICACGAVFLTGILQGRPLYKMLRTGVSLAVGAIPEGLPAIVTISLASGVQRMVKRNAVVRKLPAVETLAYATVICSDKTGTLTTNQMTVVRIYAGETLYEISGEGFLPKGSFYRVGQKIDPLEDDALCKTLTGGALCNNSYLSQNEENKSWQIQGDPTEGALLVAAAKAELWKKNLTEQIRRLQEIPFDSERRLMAVAIENTSRERIAYVKGSPDDILTLCCSSFDGKSEQPLTSEQREEISRSNEKMTEEALRVVAVAYKSLPEKELPYGEEDLLSDLTFAGLLGMIDPPRPEVQAAVAKCQQAGIKVTMVTGDQRNTATAIARKLQILNCGTVVSGKEIEDLSEEQLAKQIDQVEVIYRASPLQKLRIVQAFKKKGYVVAMTGDGVNDAPAVKEADVGIAMGRVGTDVTRETSCIVLTDDSFATIVAAIEEGRGIKSNIRKFVHYILAGNLGEVIAVFSTTLFNLPIPLDPGQILWVNLVTDGVPALALGMDPPNPDGMSYPPSRPDENVFSGKLGRKIMTRGLSIGATTMGVFAGANLLYPNNLARAKTMAFSNLVASQMFHAFDCRTDNNGEVRLAHNRYLAPSVAISSGLLLAAVYSPWIRALLKTHPLGLLDWGIILLSSGVFSRIDH